MKFQNKFRPINPYERNIIERAIRKFSSNLFGKLTKDYCFYINFNFIWKKESYPSLYLLSSKQEQFIKQIRVLNHIYSAGLYIGFIKKGNLLLSLEFVEFIEESKYLKKVKSIVVNKSGERSVLYGNDITYRMISSISEDIEKEDEVLIYNLQHELLALGKFILENEESSLQKQQNKIIFNIIDKGYYLRKKQ